MLLGFALLILLVLSVDMMASYTVTVPHVIAHIAAPGMSAFAVRRAHAHFITCRSAAEAHTPGMGRELGIGLLVGAGLIPSQSTLAGLCTIDITLNGHFSSHLRQPVQPADSIKTDVLRQPLRSKPNTCSGQAATHQPQPVQRAVSMAGNHLGSTDLMA